MIEIIAFAVFIIVLGFAVGCCADLLAATRVGVRCDCGRVVRTLTVVDPVDAARHAKTLTEECPTCRVERRASSPVEQGSSLPVEQRSSLPVERRSSLLPHMDATKPERTGVLDVSV